MNIKQKKVLIRCADDSVIILSFVLDDGHFVKRLGTKEEIDLEISRHSTAWEPSRLPIKGWEIITDEDLPSTREYRNAWVNHGLDKPKGKKIEHDMPKAREIKKNALRLLRFPLLQQLDAEYMMSLEQGNSEESNKIAKEKQRLRDITIDPRIEAAKTIEDLGPISINPQ
jgi:hypothetical protein